MTYKEYFVTEVKVNGKILRVQNDKVYLPFGSEYSLLLKNLNTKRAKVNLQIDGQDVLSGTSLVLSTNESVDLLGFMKNNQVTNKFKFIEKTQEISEHRGDKPEDGLIRIEFAFEAPAVYYHTPLYTTHWPKGSDWNVTYGQSGMTTNSMSRGVVGSTTPEVHCYNAQEVLNEAGITVKGSETKQDFVYTTFGICEPSNIIILQLVGQRDTGIAVQQPITVERKIQCKTCGRVWKSYQKFCGNCGTYLE